MTAAEKAFEKYRNNQPPFVALSANEMAGFIAGYNAALKDQKKTMRKGGK